METKQLKKYAPEARRDFIEAVTNKAAVYGLLPDEILPMREEGDVVIIGDRPFPRSVAKQRKELEARVRKDGFQQFIEAIAYTWFNRFVAIRYMELHGYLDHGYRVLSHPEGKSTPEILENAERIELPGLHRDEVVDLKLDGGKDEQLYQTLLLAQCNALNKAMPFLFESIKDGTELLLPDNLLHTDSLVRTMVNDIPEEQWQEVEIIGWLYQFYISEKKDEVIGKVVKSEDIPAATQLFTPNWIVKYLVQNSLGRQWVATYPDSPLKEQMEFYIEPAEQTPEVQQQLDEITPDSLNPEELTLLDPACGSGHILVEAYDLFKTIYQERGYRARDIPRLILTKNLFGLEIDDRAAQLAAFALLMKAHADDRAIFGRDAQPNVLSIQESTGLDANSITVALNAPFEGNNAPGHIAQADLAQLLDLFAYGKTLGTLVQIPDELSEQVPDIFQRLKDVADHGGLLERAEVHSLMPVVRQAMILSNRYTHVVTNPPYMGSKYCNPLLKSFLGEFYHSVHRDLFTSFISRCRALCLDTGSLGFMSPFVWMFISSHEAFRRMVLTECTVSSLVQLEYSGFAEATVPVCAFILGRQHVPGYQSSFIRLTDFKGPSNQGPRTLEAIRRPDCGWYFTATADNFFEIPGCPFAYWVSDAIRSCFKRLTPLGSRLESRHGLVTAANDQFVRNWFEVSLARIGFDHESRHDAQTSQHKWFPYLKGGPYRKWYGNCEHVVDWENDGHALQTRKHPSGRVWATNFNLDYIYRENVTWSDITSAWSSFRYTPSGYVFDAKSPAAFSTDPNLLFAALGLLNSNLSQVFTQVLNPTLSFQSGNFDDIPFEGSLTETAFIEEVKRAVCLSRDDWKRSETTWEFERNSIVCSNGCTLAASFEDWANESRTAVDDMRAVEEEINRRLISVYEVDGQVSPSVPDDQITLTRSDRQDDVKRLISYAIGCMMGRYSLDEPGLICANSENKDFDSTRYTTYPADEDGIIPLTDTPWCPDDATNRFETFIKTAWPVEHLEENLNFVAESLGQKRGETTRDCIRRYLATGFYKHHLSMYKKRPIYWLFSSGKQKAFQCLVYLHRYNAGTLSRMRTEYVVPLQGKMNTRIEQLESDISAAGSTSHRKKLEKERDKLIKQREELQTFDEKLRHYADRRIELDLDDGVKVNYGKFGDLLAEVKSITGKKPEVEVSG